MRLLNVRTLQFHEFFDDDVPAYAILSHTWGKNEMSYQMFRSLFPPADSFATLMQSDGSNDSLSNLLPHHKGLFGNQDGLTKILKFCQLVYKTKLKWVWVDSCCINKESSAELSEAINSMYNWYRSAEVCWAFLKDAEVVATEDGDGKVKTQNDSRTAMSDIYGIPGSITFQGLKSFQASRWFKRGWTLQELLAPADVRFFDKNWKYFGTKYGLAREINKATNIDSEILISHDSASLLEQFTVAEKMSWAAYRETTRVEDIAYSLLGIFGITMTLQYGEGKTAFLRLQKKILKTTSDETLLVWETEGDAKVGSLIGLLAQHPRAFVSAKDMVPLDVEYTPVMTSSRGASISVHYPDRVRETMNDHSSVMLPLNCTRQNAMVCIPIFNYRGIWYRVSRRLGDESNIRLLGFNSSQPVRTLDRSQRDVLYISLTPTSMPLQYPKAHMQTDTPTIAIRLDTHQIPSEMLRASLPSEVFAKVATTLKTSSDTLGINPGPSVTIPPDIPEETSKPDEVQDRKMVPLITNRLSSIDLSSPNSLALTPEISQSLRRRPPSSSLKMGPDENRDLGIENQRPSVDVGHLSQNITFSLDSQKAKRQQLERLITTDMPEARSKPKLSMAEYLHNRSRPGAVAPPARPRRIFRINEKGDYERKTV